MSSKYRHCLDTVTEQQSIIGLPLRAFYIHRSPYYESYSTVTMSGGGIQSKYAYGGRKATEQEPLQGQDIYTAVDDINPALP